MIIKITSEGAPAHGDQPAEAAFNGCLDQALNWADKQIQALGQPAVGIWNAGTQWGPIDGTSATSRAIAKHFPANQPGRIWVASSGDEGGIENHAGGDYAPGTPGSVRFSVNGNSSYPSAWYTGSAPAKVTIEFSDGTSVSAGPGEATNKGGVNIVQYRPGDEFYPWTIQWRRSRRVDQHLRSRQRVGQDHIRVSRQRRAATSTSTVMSSGRSR